MDVCYIRDFSRITDITQKQFHDKKTAQRLLKTRLDLPVKTTKIIADFYLSEYALSKRDEYFGSEEAMQLMEVAYHEGLTDVVDLVTRYIYLACATEMRHIWGGDAMAGYNEEPVDCDDHDCDGEEYDCDDCPFEMDSERREVIERLREEYMEFTGITNAIYSHLGKPFIHGLLLNHECFENTGRQFLGWASEAFVDIFGEFGGVGGRNWANIALAGYQRLAGISPFDDAKLYLDHVFSLEHNNGCFFDKNNLIFELNGGKSPVKSVCNAHSEGDLNTLIYYASNDVKDVARIIFKKEKGEAAVA